MMFELDAIKARLYQFFKLTNMTNVELGDFLDMASNSIVYLKNGDWIKKSKIIELYKLGINFNWLITGRGTIFNSNEEGKHIFKIINDRINFTTEDYQKATSNLYKWLSLNFDDLNAFCYKIDYPIEKLLTVLNSNEIGSIELLKKLEKEGLNLHWLYNRDRNPFKDNAAGRKLRSKIMNERDFNNPLYRDMYNGRNN